MNKIRINVLARELEVKAHELLDKLPELGVTEKKTHSSSIDEDVADKLRRIFGGGGAGEPAAQTSSNGSTAAVAEEPGAAPAEPEEPPQAAPEAAREAPPREARAEESFPQRVAAQSQRLRPPLATPGAPAPITSAPA